MLEVAISFWGQRMDIEKISVTLITQGKHKFYSGTMPIELIAETCSTNPRSEDPIDGFQRTLDENRAISIANYIRNGGTIPSSIILSAQKNVNLEYNSKNKTISFEKNENAFLILDGQHRVYGFRKLLNEDIKYRVPVVIYNDLTSVDEARIFIDINTLQKPVPKELLLDIKRLAERESSDEQLLDELFSLFEENIESYLCGKLSRIDRQKNKISKVTFYDALRPILKEFNITNTSKLYEIINSFLIAANDVFKSNGVDLKSIIVKPTIFKIMIAHAKAVISVISDHAPENICNISEFKRYLDRTIPGSIDDIVKSKAYTKTVMLLDKKIIKRSVTI